MKTGRLKMLKRIEALKLASRLNFVFTMIVLLLVTLQIAFAIRVETAQLAFVPASMIHTLASKYVDNIAITFLPILLMVNMTREFEYGVVQRTLVSGFYRADYYLSKQILVTSFSVCSVFLAMFFTVLTALFHDIPVSWKYDRLVMYFPVTFFMGSFSMLLALLLRKSIHALAAFIGWIMLENILLSIIQGSEIRQVLPVHVCIRMLKDEIFDWPQFVFLSTLNMVFWVAGYWRIHKMDLQ